MADAPDKKRILHVDDDGDFLEVFNLTFKRTFDITDALGGTEALELLREGHYDLVLTDYDMPHMSGLELLEKIRRMDRDLPVIFYTGQGNEQVAREAFILGVTDYFVKDFFGFAHKEKLINSIRRAVETREAEKARRDSEERFRIFFQTTPDAISITNIKDGKFLDVNRGFTEISGYSWDEAVGKTVFELGIWKNADDRDLVMEEIKKSGHISSIEFDFMPKSGKTMAGLFSGTIIKMNGENYLLSVVKDVSHKSELTSQLRQREEEYKTLLENAPYIICSVDKNYRFLYVNRIFEIELGYPLSEIVGKEIDQIDVPPELKEQMKNVIDKSISTGESNFIEFEAPRSSGRKILHSRVVPIRDETGAFSKIIAITRDVTASRESRDELEKSEQFFREFFENSPLAVFKTSLEGRILYANKAITDIIGFDSVEELKNTWTDLAKDFYADPNQRQFILEQIVKNDRLLNFEGVFNKKDGSTYWGRLHIQLVRNPDGTPKNLEGYLEDISESRKREEEKARFSRLLDNVSDAVITIDDGFCIKTWNKAAERIYGWPENEVIGRKISEVLNPQFVNFQGHRIKEAILEKGQLFDEVIETRKDGSKVNMVVSITGLFNENREFSGAIAICHDVTEERRFKKALEESMEQWRFIVDNAANLIINIDQDLRILFINRLPSGEEQQTLLGMPFAELIGEESREEAQKAVEGVFRDGSTASFDFIGSSHLQNCWFMGRISPNRREDRIISATVIATDITFRREAGMSIRRSEERMRNLVENMPVMMDAFDENLKLVAWNGECERVTGYSKEELLKSEDPLGILYPDPAYRESILDMVEESGMDFRDMEWDLRCKDGSVKTISWSNVSGAVPVEGWHSWAVGIDVTEKLKIQNQLVSKNKELEDFAFRVTHDIKSPVNLIKTYVMEAYSNKNMCDIYIDKVMKQTDTILAFIENVLKLSRSGRIINKAGCADLKGLIKSAAAIESSGRNGINLVFNGEIPLCSVDSESMLQVFSNIIQNAVKFTKDPSSGTLIQVDSTVEGGRLILTLTDNGVGIKEKYRSRIFEPGFSTSKRSGSGFGLSISRKIIEAHGGQISAVEPAFGEGACIRIILPLSARDDEFKDMF